jgi:hypothetical protein
VHRRAKAGRIGRRQKLKGLKGKAPHNPHLAAESRVPSIVEAPATRRIECPEQLSTTPEGVGRLAGPASKAKNA